MEGVRDHVTARGVHATLPASMEVDATLMGTAHGIRLPSASSSNQYVVVRNHPRGEGRACSAGYDLGLQLETGEIFRWVGRVPTWRVSNERMGRDEGSPTHHRSMNTYVGLDYSLHTLPLRVYTTGVGGDTGVGWNEWSSMSTTNPTVPSSPDKQNDQACRWVDYV